MSERRLKGRRRWTTAKSFPFVDGDGVTILANRRRLSDRRIGNIDLAERQVLLSEMPPPVVVNIL
jgi:hypothetical protein